MASYREVGYSNLIDLSEITNGISQKAEADRQAQIREAKEKVREAERERRDKATDNLASSVRSLSDVIMKDPDNANLNRALDHMISSVNTPPPQANAQVQQAKLRPMVDYSVIPTRSLTRGTEHQGGF